MQSNHAPMLVAALPAGAGLWSHEQPAPKRAAAHRQRGGLCHPVALKPFLGRQLDVSRPHRLDLGAMQWNAQTPAGRQSQSGPAGQPELAVPPVQLAEARMSGHAGGSVAARPLGAPQVSESANSTDHHHTRRLSAAFHRQLRSGQPPDRPTLHTLISIVIASMRSCSVL